MSETQHPASSAPSATHNPAMQPPSAAPSSGYFWPMLFSFLLVVAIAILCWFIFKYTQKASEITVQDTQIQLQELQNKNKILQAELAALDKLLLQEPCDILALLQAAQAKDGSGIINGLTLPIYLTKPLAPKESVTETKKSDPSQENGKMTPSVQDAPEPPPSPLPKQQPEANAEVEI